MGVSNYFEFITTLVGWILYDNFWTILTESGIVYIPFIIMIIKHIVSSRKAGDDEGSAGIQSLKKIETDLVLMVLVLFLAAVPIFTVELSEMRYIRATTDCRVLDDITAGTEAAVVSGNATGTTFDATLSTISGQTGRVPAWWGLWHMITKSVVSAAVVSLPCTGDMSSVHITLENEHITDRRVNLELQEFMEQCYMPSRAKSMRNQNAMTETEIDSVGYIGSNYFMNTRGYYDTFYSRDPRSGWAFNPVRDGGFEADQAIGGHPTCKEWWGDNQGLRNKILTSIDPKITDRYVYRARNLIAMAMGGTPAVTEREDVLLRKFFAVKNSQANISGIGNLSTSYSVGVGEQVRNDLNKNGWGDILNIGIRAGGKVVKDAALTAVALVGTAVSTPGHLAAGIAAREGGPIFLSLLLMVFVACLPFLMVFSLYSFTPLLTLTVIYFGMHFIYALWSIAFWVDNSLTAAIMGNGSGIFAAIANPMQSMIIVWTQRFLYVIFPTAWMVFFTWIGIRANGAMSGVNGLTSASEAPMSKGGDMAAGAAAKKL